jgi:hypothetical protein
MEIRKYWAGNETCRACTLKPQCSNSKQPRRMSRWLHQNSLDQMDAVKQSLPDSMLIRKQTVEHPFGTIKSWMGATHFLTRGFENVRTEMNLHVLAYNLKRMISIFGTQELIRAMQTRGEQPHFVRYQIRVLTIEFSHSLCSKLTNVVGN